MVTQLGISNKLGPLTYGRCERLQYLGVQEHEERNFSEATAQLIDQEVKGMVEQGHQRVTEILAGMRPTLDALAALLDEKKVISGDEVKQVISRQKNNG